MPLLAEITATIATASSPCPGKSLHHGRLSPHSRSRNGTSSLMSHRIPLWYIRMTQARTATIPKPNPGCSQTIPHCFQQLDGLWRRVESWTREFVDPCRHAMSTPHLCRNKGHLDSDPRGNARQKTAQEPCSESPKSVAGLPGKPSPPYSERTGDFWPSGLRLIHLTAGHLDSSIRGIL